MQIFYAKRMELAKRYLEVCAREIHLLIKFDSGTCRGGSIFNLSGYRRVSSASI